MTGWPIPWHNPPMNREFEIFDRRAVRAHRDRAAAGLDGYDFLFRAAAEGLASRLADVRRNFAEVLDLGCHDGFLADYLEPDHGTELLVQCDLSEAMAGRAPGLCAAADEELLPFRPASFDLVISCLSLHWVNDLPGSLVQARQALKPDGLFLAVMLGGGTLRELRSALLAADTELSGGAGPRISPFADVRDAGDLLGRAGFALPVADTSTLTVSYADPFRLLRDLKGMGEANSVAARRRSFTRRQVFPRAAEIYREMYGDAAGRVPATFEMITMTAWAPADTQPRPLPRGSGEVSLTDFLKRGDG